MGHYSSLCCLCHEFSRQTTSSISPLEYLLEHPPREHNCPIEALRDTSDENYEAIRIFKLNQRVVCEVADTLANEGREEYVARRNQHRVKTLFQPGMQVWHDIGARYIVNQQKMNSDRHEGPFIIKEIKEPNAVCIDDDGNKLTFHVTALKKAYIHPSHFIQTTTQRDTLAIKIAIKHILSFKKQSYHHKSFI